MKRLLTIVAMALMATFVNAQTSSSDDSVYSVIGNFVGNWDTDIDMTKYHGSFYIAVIEGVSAGNYEFKIRKNHDWSINIGVNGQIDGTNLILEVAKNSSTVVICFNSNGYEIIYEVYDEGTYQFGDFDVWTLAGDLQLLGSDWNILDTKNDMITLNGEYYTLLKKDVTLPKGTYYFKVFKENSQTESYPSNNASLVIDETATYTIEFTFNVKTKELSATTTKTDGLFFNYISKGKVAELIQNPNQYKGTVIIPSTVTHDGEEYTVTKISDYAFYSCNSLTSVTIPNSVTTIGNNAFYGCNSLTSVTIPSSVSSIGENVFYGCNSLTTLTIPSSVTSIGSSAFADCSRLTSLTIPGNVKSIGNSAFSGCKGLTSLTIGKSVEIIDYNAFSGCYSLESIVVENGNTNFDSRNNCNAIINSEENLLILGCKKTIIPNSIISIGNDAFAGCNGLTSIDIPNGVVAIGSNAFYGCKDLTSITIPNSVTSIGNSAFYGCIKLKSISAPNSNVHSGAFYGCSSLTTATFTGSYVGDNAFVNCPELKDVYNLFDVALYEQDPGFSMSIGYNMFQGSYIEYATLHVPAASINFYKNTEPWKNFGNIVALSDGDVPDEPETPKCAKPTITNNNGVITFSCETEGVEFVSEVKANDNKKEFNNKIILSNTYTVSVYATKAGYNNSETVTMEVIGTGGILGDLTGDGKVDVADHVKLSDIIMGK